jgi:hypothetical protein
VLLVDAADGKVFDRKGQLGISTLHNGKINRQTSAGVD